MTAATLSATAVGERPTYEDLLAKLEIQQLEIDMLKRDSQRKTKNSRADFRNQALREIVTPPHRDQQQHEGKRIPQGAFQEQTDTRAETIFHRLGEAIRTLETIADPAQISECHAAIAAVYREIEQRAAETGPMTWCKACGEEIRDCGCSSKKPRVG